MIKYLSESVVALNLNGIKKSYLNSQENRKYLEESLPTELWNKIKQSWGEKPYYTNEEQPLSTNEKNKVQINLISAMKEECVKAISNGVDFNNAHYSFEITDQLNLSRLAIQAKEGRENLIYHADGEVCRIFSAEEILELYTAMENFIEYHTTYFNTLKAYIKTLEYQSDLLKIEYGMEIPTNNNILLSLTNKE